MKGARLLFLILLLSFTTIQPLALLGACNQTRIISEPSQRLTSQINPNEERILVNRAKIPEIQDSSFLESPLASSDSRNWTVLVYMAADNSLEVNAFADIKEMEMVGSTDQVNIIVFVDFRTNNTPYHGPGAYTFNITQDTEPLNSTIWSQPLNTSLPTEPNMGDPTTLLQFIQFGQNYSQAAQYLLIFWDHGAGYEGVCFDETSGEDRLLPHEIATVLENDTLEPIDIVAFDADYMGQLELAYEIQNGSDFLVFSEEAIPAEGFPYNRIFQSLTFYHTSTPHALAVEIVYRYIEAYSFGGQYYSYYTQPLSTLCLSVVNTTQITSIANWFNQTVNELLTPLTLQQHYSSISAARGATQQFSIPNFIDLDCFAYQLSQQILDRNVQNPTVNLSLAIQSAVLYNLRMQGLPCANGLAINLANYEPIPLSLLNDTRYQEFIFNFQTIGETVDTAIISLISGPLRGYLDGVNDSVFFQIDTTIQTMHTFYLSPSQVYDADFDLYLFDANMNLLTRSISLGSEETIQYPLIQGQVYYLRVWSYPRDGVSYGLGSFQITIAPGASINPVTLVMFAALIVGIVALIVIVIFLVRRYREQIALRWHRWRAARAAVQDSSSPSKLDTPASGECIECGEELPKDAKFCSKCGKTFED